MPRADREALLHVHRRQLDEMLHAHSLGGLRCRFVTYRDLRTGIDEEERVDSGQRCPQRRRIREIANHDIHALTRPSATLSLGAPGRGLLSHVCCLVEGYRAPRPGKGLNCFTISSFSPVTIGVRVARFTALKRVAQCDGRTTQYHTACGPGLTPASNANSRHFQWQSTSTKPIARSQPNCVSKSSSLLEGSSCSGETPSR
jgi:hypothetical protein